MGTDHRVPAAIRLNDYEVNERIRQKIIELCQEDDYGSWELFWAVSSSGYGSDRFTLADTILGLINEGKITAKKKNLVSKELIASSIDREILLNELGMANSPDPERFYWFGI